jgi:ERCC4-type nuclease
MIPDGAAGLVIVAVAVAAAAWDRLQTWRTPKPGTVERVQRQYERGEIDLAELERRLDVLADPEADRIRETVERVNGVGEATSWAVAAEFSSLRELREASREELQSVPGVGDQRAAALDDI